MKTTPENKHIARLHGKSRQDLLQENAALKAEIERLRWSRPPSDFEEHVAEIFEVAHEAVYLVDNNWRFVYINRSAEEVWGKARNELLGKILWDVFPSIVDSTPYREQHRAMKEQCSVTFETISPVIGEWVEVNVYPKFASLLVIFHVIAKRKEMELALRESEERYRELFENAPIGIYRTAPDGRILMVNRPLLDMLGYDSLQDLASLNLERGGYASPDSRKIFKERIEREGELRGFEVGWMKRDGSVIFVRENAKAIRDDTGTIRYYEGTVEDITGRVRMEHELQDIIDGSSAAIYVKDLEGRFLTINRRLEGWLNMSRQEIYGKTDFDLYPRRLAEAYRQHDRKVIEGGVAVRIEDVAELPGGQRNVYILNKFPLFEPGGKPYALCGMALDITDLRESEERYRLLNEELEQRIEERTTQLDATVKELESFSYSVSHDLRAPLRAVNSFASILLEDHAAQLDDEGRRQLGLIHQNAKSMARLIDELLIFTRLNRQEMTTGPIDLTDLARSVFDEARGAEPPGRSIHLQLHHLPEVFGSEVLLRQVMVNLIANALKFTRPCAAATVEIGAAANDSEVTVFIRDNGVGFDEQYAGKMFGVFQRLHDQNEFEGTGIGLALVKRIVERHGGKVWAEGREDEGATFYFSLPVK